MINRFSDQIQIDKDDNTVRNVMYFNIYIANIRYYMTNNKYQHVAVRMHVNIDNKQRKRIVFSCFYCISNTVEHG